MADFYSIYIDSHGGSADGLSAIYTYVNGKVEIVFDLELYNELTVAKGRNAFGKAKLLYVHHCNGSRFYGKLYVLICLYRVRGVRVKF